MPFTVFLDDNFHYMDESNSTSTAYSLVGTKLSPHVSASSTTIWPERTRQACRPRNYLNRTCALAKIHSWSARQPADPSRLAIMRENGALSSQRATRQHDARCLAERDAREAMDDRTPAQRWLGDPPAWRSALAGGTEHTRCGLNAEELGL
jgi:hypothetical protein